MEKLSGTIEDITYYSEESGFTVFKLDADGELYTCVGVLPELTVGETVDLEGEWANHNIYGEQFKVANMEISVPTTIDDIYSYLCSGIVYGVGTVTAKKLIEAFGEETLEVLATSPQLVASVNGIGKKRAEKICESYNEHIASRDVMVKLTHYGVTVGQATKLYIEYGNNAVAVIQENVYRIIDDIKGIGFKTADAIAMKMGVDKNSLFRVEAGLTYVLSLAAMNGHVYLPLDKLKTEASRILECDGEVVAEATENMISCGKLINNDNCVYDTNMFVAETQTAERIINLINYGKKDDDFEEEIQKAIEDFPVQVSDEQRLAVETAVKNPCTIITGGPGTGKTTIIKMAIDIFSEAGKNVKLCAPTGRASKRMAEASERDATTIHRLLEFTGDGRFSRDENNPIEADVVIVDETSMVDADLIYRLISAIPTGAKLIFIGDADQLMSVGAGNVLGEMIASGCVPTVRLTRVYRQGEGSGIVLAAHSINNGEMPRFTKDGDIVFAEINNATELREKLMQYFRVMKKRLSYEELLNIQVLCPSKKGEVGTVNLNKHLQTIVNPSDWVEEKKIGDVVYRRNDKVMQIKNNYDIEWTDDFGNEDCGVFNGDVGRIWDINSKAEMMTVVFDDGKQAEYAFSDVEQLIHAYAVTVHKSQGSEFDTVLMVLNAPSPLLTRNLLYTAVTRAKKKLYLLGSKGSLEQMIGNNKVYERYTNLAKYLKEEQERVQQ